MRTDKGGAYDLLFILLPLFMWQAVQPALVSALVRSYLSLLIAIPWI